MATIMKHRKRLRCLCFMSDMKYRPALMVKMDGRVFTCSAQHFVNF